MISLFSTAKAFDGHTAVIQENALDSWRALAPDVEVLLFGDDPGTAEAARLRGFRHFPNVERTEHGTPLLSDIFRQAVEKASNQIICYVNADIILRPDFVAALRQVAEQYDRFLAVAQRVNLEITERLSFDEDAARALAKQMCREGLVEPPDGIDFFAFTRRAAVSLPPFAVGRPCWDNWLIMDAKRRGIPVVDVTPVCRIVHQNHGYRHVPQGSGRNWEGPEADANRALAAIAGDSFSPADYTILSADVCLHKRGLRPMTPFQRWSRRLRHHPAWPQSGYRTPSNVGAGRWLVRAGSSSLRRLLPRSLALDLKRRAKALFAYQSKRDQALESDREKDAGPH